MLEAVMPGKWTVLSIAAIRGAWNIYSQFHLTLEWRKTSTERKFAVTGDPQELNDAIEAACRRLRKHGDKFPGLEDEMLKLCESNLLRLQCSETETVQGPKFDLMLSPTSPNGSGSGTDNTNIVALPFSMITVESANMSSANNNINVVSSPCSMVTICAPPPANSKAANTAALLSPAVNVSAQRNSNTTTKVPINSKRNTTTIRGRSPFESTQFITVATTTTPLSWLINDLSKVRRGVRGFLACRDG